MSEWLCDGCQKVFETEEEVLEHEKTCEKTLWICDGCQKIFEIEEKALEHEKTCQKAIDFVKRQEEGEIRKKKKPLLEETVSIDEAVNYGFNMFKGIAKYIIYIIILNGIGFFFVIAGASEDTPLALLGIPFIIAAIILNIALSIGVLYKLWVDILARSRK